MIYDPEPHVVCLTHNTKRYCHQHRRAEFPPDAAKRWIKRHDMGGPSGGGSGRPDGTKCEIVYRAGVVPRGRIEGQKS